MNSAIRIAVLPLDISLGDCEKNLLTVAANLHNLPPDTDLLVLPELFTSGFVKDKERLEMISAYEDATLAAIKGWSERLSIAIAGSFLARDGGRYFNRGFFIEPSGESTFYDKKHLFCLSPESSILTAGETPPPLIRYRGWNIALIICYDLRFPVWCRNRTPHYDMLIVPANWPASRGYAWEHLLIARAIENQAIVVGANRSGTDDFGCYNGLSYIFDQMGKPLATSQQNLDNGSKRDGIIYAEASMEHLRETRRKMPVANDADSFNFV